MCGIAGFIGAGTIDDLHRMTRQLAHRGPDAEGFWHGGPATGDGGGINGESYDARH